ncbi:AAA family ATPase [Gluconobacter wancherniae]|uniref:AAA family ATPase n=1 Tax=Gluconobacter wancherniae TaxID=1307955 RepID=UPI001B8CFD40|nr:AAA family ATPase [Gluconobacter wancherniae]MBS1095196.1 AAA family ATPase [Gluconobacter wancherniae]
MKAEISSRFSEKTEEECYNNFVDLCKYYSEFHHDWNEANTRHHFINKFLNDCLGWPDDSFNMEEYINGDYADYIIGKPEKIIIEAKKEGIYFDLPPGSTEKPIQSIKTIFRGNDSAKKAIEQVQKYCSGKGVEYAVVCNGHQLIAFVAIKIGDSPLAGKALVLNSLEAMKQHFGVLWQSLSPLGISEGRLNRILTNGSAVTLPPKPSSRLTSFPQIRYQSTLQATLRDFSELLIEDIVNTSELEGQFYDECYCDTGALSRDALLSKRILSARYASLFPETEESPRMQAVDTRESHDAIFSKDMLQEALSRRPIVLIGDVGVGKTSFIKNLFLRKASEEARSSILLFIDFGSQATLSGDVKEFVLDEVENQLFTKYNIDIQEENIVNGIYNSEIKKFKQSIFYKSADDDHGRDKLIIGMLVDKVKNKSQHLKKVIEHLAKARRKQVVIVLDNADQRRHELQQDAFLIAQEFANSWQALVFISLRPQTFFQSTRSGALAAYPNKVFTISPPRPELVIEKRLQFALRICEGDIKHASYTGLNIRVGSMVLFLRALISSMKSNKEIREILSNITGGNIREVVQFVKKFIGSPNVDADKIIDIMTREGEYLIPLHEFSKAAILGDFAHYNPMSSLASNLFDVHLPDEREHFLSTMILEYMNSEYSKKDADGFVSTESIEIEMQKNGFTLKQIENKLRHLNNKKLIESTLRVTFDENVSGLFGDMPHAFRVTSVGSYHTLRWLASFSYLDAMVFDTPIFRDTIFEEIITNKESFHIADRFERVLKFRSYLTETWNKSGINVPYFDWQTVVERDEQAFAPIRRAIMKMSSS